MYKKLIDETVISEQLFYTISMSEDDSSMYVEVNYQHGKFVIEKMFKNNTFDLENLEIFIRKINSVDKIIEYLNLGEAYDN